MINHININMNDILGFFTIVKALILIHDNITTRIIKY